MHVIFVALDIVADILYETVFREQRHPCSYGLPDEWRDDTVDSLKLLGPYN